MPSPMPIHTVRRERTGEHARRTRPLAPPATAPARLGTGSHAVRRSTSQLPRRLAAGRLVRGAVLVGVAGLAALGVVQLAGLVEKTDALPVRSLAVLGVQGDRTAEILAYAGVTAGEPLFAVDTEAVAARVLEHPFVASARVRRVAPDGIEITVTSRSPQALLVADDSLYLVDADGNVMKSARIGDGLDLPVLTGFDAAQISGGAVKGELADAVAIAAAHEKAGAPGGPLAEVHFVPAVGFDLVLGGGERVRVGRNNIEDKLARLGEVLRRLDDAGQRASEIYIDDERRPERAAVRLRTEAETRPAGGLKNIPRERG